MLSGEQNIARSATKKYNIDIIEEYPGQTRNVADFIAANNRYDYLEDCLESRLGEVLCRPEMEDLGSPLLAQVGIMDINKVITAMGQESQESLLEMAKIGMGSHPIYLFRHTVETEVRRRPAVWKIEDKDDEGKKPSWLINWIDLSHLQNSFYPVDANGFIGQLANTKLWSRLLGVPQLSWDRNYPINNEHSRGSHSLYATVNASRVLQALYDSNPDKLVDRLRKDFLAEGIIDGSEADDYILQLAPDLAVLLAMSHDIYTPLGGDMMKNIIGMDEEADIENLLRDASNDFEAEYLKVVYDRGLDDRHIQFVINCVQGKSSSLVGQLIHSEDGDVLEQDRLAYTMQDLFSAGILNIALPKYLYEGRELEYESSLETYFWEARRQLADRSLVCVGPMFAGDVRPTLTLLDVADDYTLDDNLDLVCTRPDKLAWLAAFRVMMSAEFYQGSKLRGQQHDFGMLVNDLLGQADYDELFSKQNLLRSTNKEFQTALLQSSDPRVVDMIRDMSSALYPHKYDDRVVEDASEYDNTWLKVPIKIKAGLDTKVLSSDRVMSLGEYADGHRRSRAVALLCGVSDEYAGKTRVIKRSNKEN